jgi:broad specificity phosphatase PhoE
MPDSLIVIRSGATDYELQGRIRGAVDIPLAAAGIVEAEQAAAGLAAMPLEALYSSPATCAAETARIIGLALSLRPRFVTNLHNLDQGLWQGLLVDDLRRKQPRVYREWQENPWNVAPPEGELLEEACGRVEPVLERILRRHPAGRVAIVVPEPLDRLVRWLVAAEPLGDLWSRDPAEPMVADMPVASQWGRSQWGRSQWGRSQWGRSTRGRRIDSSRRIPAQSRG